nr:SIR2 family protein [uncultured Methanoregula sp.]
MPKEIYNSLISEKLIIFAGSGISTEKSGILQFSFYDEICKELKIKPNPEKYPFPTIMTKYCEKFGRSKFIEKIFNRFQVIQSYPSLYYHATEFHKELSTIYQIRTIFTTNWDTFFEDVCGALPFVTSQDFVYWNFPERKVFKIHGSISNIGSIIATEDDYKRSYSQLKGKLIGNYLKIALSTFTFVFCGFSMRDPDFQKILLLLKKELKEYSPKFYLVTIDHQIDREQLEKFNIQPIFTDAVFFLHKLKIKLIKEKYLLNEKIFIDVCQKRREISVIHQQITEDNLSLTYPSSIYTLSYQDGIKDAFDRILMRSNTGEYSNCCQITSKIHFYQTLVEKFSKEKNYVHVAYIRGYLNGLFFLVLGKKAQKAMPLFYLYDEEMNCNYDEYKMVLEEKMIFHKKANDIAQKIVNDNKIGVNGIVFEHGPSFPY